MELLELEKMLNLNPFNFIIASGVIQIFIFSGILFTRKEGNSRSNMLLSLLLLAVNFYLAYLMLLDVNLDNRYPWLLRIPYSYLLAIGPLIYFYTRSFTQPAFIISKKLMIHFLPLGLEVMLQAIQILSSVLSGELYYNVFSDRFIAPMIYIGAAISIPIYLKKSLSEIVIYEQSLLQRFSEIGKKTLMWLSSLLKYYRLFWVFWIPFAVIFLALFRGQIQNLFTVLLAYTLLLLLTYLTYWIGLQGLLKGSAISQKTETKSLKKGSYDHISEEEIAHLKRAIKASMEEDNTYLNASLSLQEFAILLGKEANLVSFILNKHMKQTFYQLVNTYRIGAVKKKIEQDRAEKFTLLAIAFECGFNSKTSFNRVFKEIEGVTPSQYLKEKRNN